MKRSPVGPAVVCAASLLLAGCGGTSSDGSTGGQLTDGQTFTLAVGSDPGSLDPGLTVLAGAMQVDRFLYDSLVNVDAAGKVVAGLATSWTESTTRAEFTLRPGITCSDGSPLTADTVAANLNYLGNPANKSPLTGLFVPRGLTATADPAKGTVAVVSPKPDAFLLRNVGGVAIVCAKGLKDRGILARGADGTGMFTLESASPGNQYTLIRRKDYAWGPGDWNKDEKGLPDKVVVRVVTNQTTAANLLLQNQANAATIIGPDRHRLLAQKLFHTESQAPTGELFFNQAAGHPGHDDAVRRAVVQALDLDAVGKVLTDSDGMPMQSMVGGTPPICPIDSPITDALPKYDAAAANAALDKAGWVKGPDGIRAKAGKQLALTLLYNAVLGSAAPELAQLRLKDLGVKLELKPVDAPSMSKTLYTTGEWDLWIGSIGFTLPTQVVPFASGAPGPAGLNFGHVDNPAYNKLVERAATMVAGAGCATWNEAELALVKDLDAVPFVSSVRRVFGKNAKFQVSQFLITPSSIRMYSGAQ